MTAAAPTDDEILARLGVHPAEPFDWGDETPVVIASTTTSSKYSTYQNAPLSGLASLKNYVEDTTNGKEDVTERQILQSLLRGAKIDFSTSDVPFSTTKTTEGGNDREENALPDEMMDVSIKGLSDRAVAELNCESRSSLFGSILRLFDVPRKEEISGEGNKIEKSKGSGDQGVGKQDGTASATAADADATATATSTSPAAGAAVAVTVPATVKAPTAPAPAIAKEIESMIMKDPILSTAEIVRTVHLAARPGDIPAGFDSKEYTMAVLRFLSSDIPYLHENEAEYRGKEDGLSQEGWDQLRMTLPILPLIKATNPESSLELRCYGRVRPLVKLGEKERKQYPDSMDLDDEFRRKVLNLELIFSSSLPFSSPCMHARLSSKLTSGSTQLPTSSQPSESATASTTNDTTIEQKTSGNDLRFAFQRFVPRRKLVPNIEGGAKEELTLMISGHMQQPENTPGPKPRLTKSRKEALLGISATATVDNSAGHLKATLDKVKGVVVSQLTPSKRKHSTAANDSVHPPKKGK
ncbi:hypothetical protein ACHAWU_009548 [Discostella pseudostelligera]|uniref:Uncharacterized protein n=1 Tax=Discostella pseudostelligera TaxID=259834 RepID=A0ABD3MAF5_9STRA